MNLQEALINDVAVEPYPNEGPIQKRHTISLLVKNVPGLLAQIANLFAARGRNIDSLTVSETESKSFSRITLVVQADDLIIGALQKRLDRFIDVIEVVNFTSIDYVECDLALVKVHTTSQKRHEIVTLVKLFKANVVDIGVGHMTIQMAGPQAKIDAFINMMRPFGIKELARTGRLAMAKGMDMKGYAS